MPEITVEYLASQGLSPTFEKRFWAKVKKTDGCWLWMGFRDKNGYGRVHALNHSQNILAHRAMWLLVLGPVPSGKCVLHHCDNPTCVRPDHLWLGTMKDNTQDMMKKGRNYTGVPPKGEAVWNHKLTAKDVLEIKRRFLFHTTTQAQSARDFGIAKSTVGSIVHGQWWKHVHVEQGKFL